MDTTTIVGLSVLAGLLVMSSLFGCYVARAKNRPTEEGFLFGLLLGPAGVIAEACLPVGTEREDAEAAEARRQAMFDRIDRGASTQPKKTPAEETRRQARQLLGEVDE
jgi:hypothetical protein